MKKGLIAILFMMVTVLSLFSGCGGSGGAVTINVYNWGEYISKGQDGTMDVIAEFERETGIKVNYKEFDENESMYTKIKNGGSNYDVVIPSDYMVAQMIREDMLEKLDFTNIPNADNVLDELKNPKYDPTGEYSVPYMWGTVGIIYDKVRVTKPVDSWNILWDAEYSGQILMFNNPRDAFGIALKKLGYSYNTTDETQIRAAADELKKQRDVVQAYVMDQIFDKMESGEAMIAPYYAGDAVTMMANNPDLAFSIPKEGTNRFVDAACILKGSKHKKEAELFINFLAKAEVSKANSEYIGYTSPMKTTYDLLDDEIKNNPIIYPPESVLSKTESFLVLPNETLELYTSLWTDIKAGKE